MRFSQYARRKAIAVRRANAIARAADNGHAWPRVKGPLGRPRVKDKRAIAYCLVRIKDGDIRPESRWEHCALRRKFGATPGPDCMRQPTDRWVGGMQVPRKRRYRSGGVKYMLYREWFPLVLAAFLAGPNAGTPGAKYRPGETVKIGNADLI